MNGRAWVFAVVTTLLAASVRAEDWPRWMGPRGDMIVRETGLAQRLPETPKPLWEAKVGVGFSSPVARDGKVYVFALLDGSEVLYCFDAESGKEVWKQAYKGGWTGSYPGTRGTPTLDGKHIYTYGGGADLVCREIDSGREVWKLNILKETGTQNQKWGMAPSPLIDGDVLYVQAGLGGPAAVAVDKTSGKILWKSEADSGSYATVALADVDKTRQLIVFGSRSIYGLDPKNGKTLWSHPWETKYDVHAATPIYRDGHLLIGSDYGKGAIMLKLSATGAAKLWESQDAKLHFQPAILEGDVLYLNSEGTLNCLSWPDGKVKWSSKDRSLLGRGGTLLRYDDKLLAGSEKGKFTLLKATPSGVEPINSMQLFEAKGDNWATPLIYNGRLYIKSPESLICLDFRAK